ncbi:family 78 glycoside hydrolase catalytic domain [Parabacteroides sp. PF5-9]|uniref:family 78 glycoside hydrolase catalytic domain n=1 Tax=Parabacteroides sp. PF5-9 TaxID=1742404 RepID=UPI0024732EFD|nr:family 78 glycoside hydrolase catalytic domain [Parabacteroides sp. PF5-9]MDH6357311.1 alpha-L-rhamnosidase [Parabacteroides sp. PF5-9]
MKKLSTLLISSMVSIIAIMTIFTSCVDSQNQTISNLTVTALGSPLAVDIQKPDFAWQMQSQIIGIKQTSYRLLVATDDKFNNIVWDSGQQNTSQSVGIVYGNTGNAAPLQAETDYYWKVDITDNKGGTHSAASTFSTGLMNPKLAAWNGAEWIGNTQWSLDAPSAQLFHINTKFRILEGNKISLIFGANDFRLNDKFQNVGNVEGENYIRWELDITNVGKREGAVINLYRVGYAQGDDPNVPYKTISLATNPETNINKLITAVNARQENTLDIIVQSSEISTRINGEQLILASGRQGGIAVVSPLNRSGNNFNTFPNLNAIGFYTGQGEKVEFTDYNLCSVGQSDPAILFGPTQGSTYSIFKDIKGLKVLNNKITVDSGAFGYADPSHYESLAMFRTEFDTEGKNIAKAKIYITAMGAYEMFINGKRLGDDWFNPGMSQYRETLTYHAYDVTSMLNKGKNAIGTILGPGFYTGYMTFTPSNYNFFGDHEALLAKLVITYTDGSQKCIVTDRENWKTWNQGPIEAASMFQGQRYNANKEEAIAGWDKPGYNDTTWNTPDNVSPREWIHFDITARRDKPIREIERLQANRVLKTHSERGNTYTYDIGVAMVGVPSVTIPAGSLKEGDTVILRFGEEIYPGNEDSPNQATPAGVTYVSLYGPNGAYRPGVAGRVLHDTYRAALATDFYIASKADESRDVLIEPHFTYRGYRYIQITVPSRTSPLPLQNVKSIVLSSEPVTGTYEGETTDITGALINQLYKNIQRSQLGNFFSIPTDCPQRNERMGWTGDAQAYARTSTYNGDVQAFFRQWMVALRNDQAVGGRDGAPAGGIGSTVPTYSRNREETFADGTTWAAAVCMVPWQLYQQYGDLEVVRENFATMKLWLEGMNHYTVPGYEGLSSRTTGLADWLSVDTRTTSDICNNAIYLHMMEITAIMAEAIGETNYAKTLQNRHTVAKESFNRAYVNPETGMTRSISLTDGKVVDLIDSQTSYATPLNFNAFSETMTITAGENAGMTYKAYAAKRLAELAANPSRSGNEGTVMYVRRPGFGMMPPGGISMATNPTEKSLDNTITTGFSGTPNILPALTRTGNVEAAYKMFACTDYASWLYPVKLGSTSMWERWNSYELAFQMNGESSMNSFNHFALGSVGSWIHEYHLGITTDGTPGYQNFILQPLPGGTYTSASGSYASNYGVIKSSWTADKGKLLTYDFTIPANTTATLYLPIDERTANNFTAIDGIRYIGMETRNGIQTAKFTAEAGGYHMTFGNGTTTVSLQEGYKAN